MALSRRLVAALGSLVLLTIACGPVARSPSSEIPSASASSSSSPTEAASAAPSATPSATAIGTAKRTPIPLPSLSASDLVVRLERSGELCCPRPVVVVMTDGRFVTAADNGQLTERVLTAAGAQRVRTEVLASGLFDKDQFIPLEPQPGVTPPAHGISGFTLRAWSGTRIASVSWPVLPESEKSYYKPSPARERADQLATRLLSPETWLPTDAWTTLTPRPHAVSAYRFVTVTQPVGGTPPNVTAVDWPFTTSLLDFGDPLQNPTTIPVPFGPGDFRCATIAADDARAIRTVLERAGAMVTTMFTAADFTTALATGNSGTGLVLFAEPLFPDRPSCTSAY